MSESCSLLPSISHFVRISPPIYLSFHKPFIFPLSLIKPDRSHCRCHRRDSPPPAIYAHSISKPRARKKVKSNADLCNDIREFLSTVGLPEDHVPSTKELLQHGRQDLANIVRRRGYKLIKELIATSTIPRRTESDKEEGTVIENKISGQSKEEDMPQDAFLSCEVPVMKNCSNSVNGANNDPTSASDCENLAMEHASTSSLQEKVAKFIYDGELDAIEGDNIDILNEIAADGGEELLESESVAEESTLDTEQSGRFPDRSNTAKTSNGSTSQLKQGIRPAKDNNMRREDYISRAGLFDGNGCDELEVEIQGRMNGIEVNRLKWMLHQKELELSRLKEEIKKEKLALFNLQTEAEAEISKAQNLLLETDGELRDAEEILSGLEEVQIEYNGHGETVELVGSFNGWDHRINMDPEPSSIILDPSGSRKYKLWNAVLWLYPGNYEIKFVVDGDWVIDPHRESITRGSIQNNILRVDRR